MSALVTGATGEIGGAVVSLLLSEGYQVHGTYHTNEKGADKLRSRGVEMVKRVAEISGEPDLYVACQGVLEPPGMQMYLPAPMRANFGTVVDDTWSYTKRVSTGSIVYVSSNAAIIGGSAYPQYAAAKAAVIAYGKAMARLLAPRFRVNCIAAGRLETRMCEHMPDPPALLKRKGTVEEIAHAVLFFAKASYVTGEVLVIDGGESL